MTESFQVASLKDMGLILHQGHFIGKPELGDALFGAPPLPQEKETEGPSGKEMMLVKGDMIPFPLDSEL